jgi:hypothetical protein
VRAPHLFWVLIPGRGARGLTLTQSINSCACCLLPAATVPIPFSFQIKPGRNLPAIMKTHENKTTYSWVVMMLWATRKTLRFAFCGFAGVLKVWSISRPVARYNHYPRPSPRRGTWDTCWERIMPGGGSDGACRHALGVKWPPNPAVRVW